jgi:hypothetical protein
MIVVMKSNGFLQTNIQMIGIVTVRDISNRAMSDEFHYRTYCSQVCAAYRCTYLRKCSRMVFVSKTKKPTTHSRKEVNESNAFLQTDDK